MVNKLVNKQLIGQVIDRLWQVSNELAKDNEQVIERLKKGGWYVVCKTKQDVDLLLLVCKKAGIKWIDGSEAIKWIDLCPEIELTGFEIGFCRSNKGLTHAISNAYDELGLENITDWFFNAIRGENNG